MQEPLRVFCSYRSSDAIVVEAFARRLREERLGDLLGALGQGEQARQLYTQSLEIRERLAVAEPDCGDYQRDLSVSYERLGDLLGALGQGEQARQLYTQSLEIAQRLAVAEPDRADYQRDLSIVQTRLADLDEQGGTASRSRWRFRRRTRV